MIAHLFMIFNYFLKEVKIMLDKWTGEVVGTMHIYGISFTKLANQMGISNRYPHFQELRHSVQERCVRSYRLAQE